MQRWKLDNFSRWNNRTWSLPQCWRQRYNYIVGKPNVKNLCNYYSRLKRGCWHTDMWRKSVTMTTLTTVMNSLTSRLCCCCWRCRLSHETGRSRPTTIDAANFQSTSMQPEETSSWAAEGNEFHVDDFGVSRRRHRLDDMMKTHRRLIDRAAASTFGTGDDDQMTAGRWSRVFQTQEYPADGSSDWHQSTSGSAIIGGNRFAGIRSKTQLQPPVETVVSAYQYPITN